MPDPITITLDCEAPTEPGMYLAKFVQNSGQPLEFVKVLKVDNYRAKRGLWLFRDDGNGPLELYDAYWSRRIIVEQPNA